MSASSTVFAPALAGTAARARTPRSLLGLALLAAAACDPDPEDPPTPPAPPDVEVQDTYAFASRFVPGASSVAYSGQAARMLLLRELSARIERTNDAALAGRTAEQLRAGFDFLFDFRTDNGGTPEEPLTVDAFGTPLLQQTIGEVGVASLRDKLRDVDLDDATPVVGWKTAGRTASGVADDILDELVATLVARQTAAPTTPGGAAIAAPFVDGRGVDHRALLVRYLHGAVALSQATDDYLDDATPAKGLLSDNSAAVEGKPYTALEHAWDEAFGYFGAARAFGAHTDVDNAAGVLDGDGDGRADWLTEVNFGDARDAARRDDDSATGTRFGAGAFQAFVFGRQLVATVAGPLSTKQLDDLRLMRALAETQWERSLGATAVAHLNELVALLDAAGADPAAHDFVGHARLWSELKGTLLGLQFAPRSPWRAQPDDYAAAHALLGDAPVIDPAGFADARADLLALRGLLQTTYAFDDADVAAW